MPVHHDYMPFWEDLVIGIAMLFFLCSHDYIYHPRKYETKTKQSPIPCANTFRRNSPWNPWNGSVTCSKPTPKNWPLHSLGNPRPVEKHGMEFVEKYQSSKKIHPLKRSRSQKSLISPHQMFTTSMEETTANTRPGPVLRLTGHVADPLI